MGYVKLYPPHSDPPPPKTPSGSIAAPILLNMHKRYLIFPKHPPSLFKRQNKKNIYKKMYNPKMHSLQTAVQA